MLSFFESQDRRTKDLLEIRQMYTRYGDEAEAVLWARAKDSDLTSRDRQHWKRLARKARRFRSEFLKPAV